MAENVLRMPRGEYNALDRVNWSSLKWMARSPAHYRHMLTHQRADTEALRRGRCVHLAVFEPHRWVAECAAWDGDRRAGKAWEAFREANLGKEILKVDEVAEILNLADAVRSNPTAKHYLSGGKAEAAVLWEFMGIPCKGMMDYISDAGAILDLKTVRDASPSAFGRAVMNYDYLAQLAWYVDGYAAATGKMLPGVLLAAESTDPYVVQPYRVPDHFIQMGRERYSALLERLVECRESNRWPGYADGEIPLELPAWAAASDDEGIDELGLTIKGAA